MIGNSTFDYVFIQSCIYGLHVIAPLSLLYCLIQILRYGLTNAASHRIPILLELWAASEATFYLLVHFWYRSHLQSAARHPPAPSREARKELFELCNANIPDPETYLRKWFLGAPTETIKRGNLKEFLLWAFFNRGGPPADDNEELEEYVVATERLLGRKIEAGRGSATCLRLTLDQVTMLHRSILWYSVSPRLVNVFARMPRRAKLTMSSASGLWISLPSFECSTAAFTSIVYHTHNSSRCSHCDQLAFLAKISLQPNISLIGIVHILPKPNCPSSSSTA